MPNQSRADHLALNALFAAAIALVPGCGGSVDAKEGGMRQGDLTGEESSSNAAFVRSMYFLEGCA